MFLPRELSRFKFMFAFLD